MDAWPWGIVELGGGRVFLYHVFSLSVVYVLVFFSYLHTVMCYSLLVAPSVPFPFLFVISSSFYLWVLR